MFEFISIFQALVSETEAKVSELETSINDISTAIDDFSGISTDMPSFSSKSDSGTISISPPTITVPSIPSFTYSLIPTGSALIKAIDPCHFDLGLFGSIMKVLMEALSTVIDAVIDDAIDALRGVVEVFMSIIGPLSSVWEWLKSTSINIWNELKIMCNTIFNNKKDCEKQAENATSQSEKNTASIKASLWGNILTWYHTFMKKIGDAWRLIKKAVSAFVQALVDAGDFFMEKLSELIKAFSTISKDWNCLTKQCTQGFK
jgi:phage-related minor tail protein